MAGFVWKFKETLESARKLRTMKAKAKASTRDRDRDRSHRTQSNIASTSCFLILHKSEATSPQRMVSGKKLQSERREDGAAINYRVSSENRIVRGEKGKVTTRPPNYPIITNMKETNIHRMIYKAKQMPSEISFVIYLIFFIHKLI